VFFKWKLIFDYFSGKCEHWKIVHKIMYIDNQQNLHQKSKKKSWKMKLTIIFILAISIYFLNSMSSKGKEQIKNSEEQKQEEFKDENIEKKEKVVEYIVSEGDIPAEIFYEYANFSANDVETLLKCSEDVYDFTNLKIGQKLEFIYGENDEVEKIRYYLGTEKMVVVERDGDAFRADKEDIQYDIQEETISIKIDEFFYKDAMDAGLSESSILEVADVFSFDIDFMTDIRVGDEVKIIYEKRTYCGKEATDGNILAAKFVNDGQEYFAYCFESEGEGSHYDSDGKELLRQFLKAPLSYRRITSGYTGARLHPITKKVTAHYQIDYAAPVGTPVVSTARGTVTSAGWEGGWGNIIRIQHDNGYTTHYGHLSAFAKGIRSGVSVSQGQVVGYVGSTGWSTGPHLDYGMRLNGAPVNPLSLKLPKGTPLQGEEMEKFLEIKAGYDEKLR